MAAKRTAKGTAERVDVYAMIQEQILAELDKGVVPWAKPWNAATGQPMSMQTNRPYRGINVFLLGIASMAHGYTSRWWLTYKQAAERGGTVRKGEKGTRVVLWKPVEKRDRATGDVTDKFLVLRYYTVFNLEQCDGIEDPDAGSDNGEPVEPIQAAEDLWSAWVERPEVKHGGGRAYYSPLLDYIGVPERDSFHTAEGYYATLYHEGIHATAHEKRLHRKDALGNGFGSDPYGREELVAEFGAAMLCAIVGIESNVQQHAAYIASWRKVIAGDPKLVVQAAAQAQRAADYVQGIVHEKRDEGASTEAPSKPVAEAA